MKISIDDIIKGMKMAGIAALATATIGCSNYAPKPIEPSSNDKCYTFNKGDGFDSALYSFDIPENRFEDARIQIENAYGSHVVRDGSCVCMDRHSNFYRK